MQSEVTTASAQAAEYPLLALPAPVSQRSIVQITLSAGTAFKIGFFGAIGAAVVSVLTWLVVVILFGSCIAAALRPTGT